MPENEPLTVKVSDSFLGGKGDNMKPATPVADHTPAPAAEPQAVTPVVTTEPTPNPAEPKAAEPEVKIDYSKVAGGKFKSEDELTAHLSEYDTLRQRLAEIEGKKLNPKAEKYNEFISAHPDKEDIYWNVINKDFTALPDLEAIKEHRLLFNEDGLSKEEIQAELNATFRFKKLPVITEDSSDEEKDLYADVEAENKALEAKIKREASKAKKEIDGFKEKYKVTPEPQIDPKAFKEAQDKAENDYKESLKAISKFEEEIVVDTKENQKIKFGYELKEEQKQFLTDVFMGRKDIFSKYQTKDGFDLERFNKDMIFLEHKDEILAAASTQGFNSGKEYVIKDRKNIDFSTNPAIPNDGAKKAQDAQRFFGG